MQEQLISVVIPVYNEEERVARVLESMQRQTYQNLEILVVDDGSTDGTCAIVEEAAKKDPRVMLHHNPKIPPRKNWRGYDINAGWAARNYGFAIARGEWLTTQDADDASLLNRIEVQHYFAQKYNASLVTVQWTRLTDQTLGRKLNVERLIKEKGEENLLIKPEELAERARRNRGLLMIEPLHRYIPFTLKWFPYTRRLFYRRTDSYPGADNCMLFHKSVRDAGVMLRPRNERTWGVPSGRGSGRDFVYRVAIRFKNSYSLKLPLYLWNVKNDNLEYPQAIYEQYLTI